MYGYDITEYLGKARDAPEKEEFDPKRAHPQQTGSLLPPSERNPQGKQRVAPLTSQLQTKTSIPHFTME